MGSFLLVVLASSSLTPVSGGFASSEVNVEIEPSLSLAIVDKNPNTADSISTIDKISMEIAPNSSGVFVSNTAYLWAGSNNETGYTLTFSDGDDDTDLVSSGSSITATIPSVTSASSNLTDIELNRWGYAFGPTSAYALDPVGNTPALGDVFNPIPKLSTPTTLASTTAEGANTYPFTVAAKIDTAVPAGVYEDSLVFSLVANYVPPKYLQTFTSNECQALSIGEELTLTDIRDNKQYTIGKLKDNKCWFLQNLRLGNFGQDLILKPEDSDVATVIAIPASQIYASDGFSTDYDSFSIYDRSNYDMYQIYGNLYSWYTATAGAGTSAVGDANVNGSVCPKGWRLPIASANNSNNDFYTLYNSYGNNYQNFIHDFHLQMAGYYASDSKATIGVGEYTYLRSSTGYRTQGYNVYAYRLYVNKTSVDVTTNNAGAASGRNHGMSIRCIAR